MRTFILILLLFVAGCQYAQSKQRIVDASVKAKTVGEGTGQGKIVIEESTIEVIDPRGVK